MMKNKKTKADMVKKKSTRVNKPPVTEKGMDGVFVLYRDSLVFIFKNWRIFSSILVTYALLDVFFVSGLSIGNSSKAVTGNNILSRGISVFNNVTSTASTINSNSGIYQTIFGVIISLAVIYVIRHLYAKKEVTISDAFYKGHVSINSFNICPTDHSSAIYSLNGRFLRSGLFLTWYI